MEDIVLRIYGPAIVVSASLALAPAGWAQSNPSANDLIKSLTPTAQSLKSSGTRGLHRLTPSSDEAAPAAAEPTGTQPVRHAAVETRAAGVTAEAPSASLFVQFPSGSAELTPRAMVTLDELGKALSSNALSTYHFRIEGHTDTVGSKDFNRALSERRAAAVAAYIKQKFGVEDSRMVPVGLGSDHLLVPTGDQTPEARNRRVQVVNLGA
jgi:outer membrane protein OmpA-like peptidoglycan-associated protein